MTAQSDVTRLLQEYKDGNRSVLDELFPLVYAELRRLAASKLNGERAEHTLQATALVHEAYLRLVNQHSVDWTNRAHFFGLASEMMRRILVNHALERKRLKRGSGETKIALDEAVTFAEERELDLVELDESLNELAKFAPRQAKIIELKFFGGLTNEESAEALGISPETVKRDWRVAKSWLKNNLGK
jgi:RNA polymerase sigma-70 factor, ECF subfamily